MPYKIEWRKLKDGSCFGYLDNPNGQSFRIEIPEGPNYYTGKFAVVCILKTPDQSDWNTVYSINRLELFSKDCSIKEIKKQTVTSCFKKLQKLMFSKVGIEVVFVGL